MERSQVTTIYLWQGSWRRQEYDWRGYFNSCHKSSALTPVLELVQTETEEAEINDATMCTCLLKPVSKLNFAISHKKFKVRMQAGPTARKAQTTIMCFSMCCFQWFYPHFKWNFPLFLGMWLMHKKPIVFNVATLKKYFCTLINLLSIQQRVNSIS